MVTSLVVERKGKARCPIAKASTGVLLLGLVTFSLLVLGGCSAPLADKSLTEQVNLELVDWHIAGLWIINCPVAWVRVTNFSSRQIKDVTFKYSTYDYDGHLLDEGTFTIDGEVPAGTTKNFIELYLGLVNLHSEKLSIQLLSVAPG